MPLLLLCSGQLIDLMDIVNFVICLTHSCLIDTNLQMLGVIYQLTQLLPCADSSPGSFYFPGFLARPASALYSLFLWLL